MDHVFGKIDCEAKEKALCYLESSVCHEYLLLKKKTNLTFT